MNGNFGYEDKRGSGGGYEERRGGKDAVSDFDVRGKGGSKMAKILPTSYVNAP